VLTRVGHHWRCAEPVARARALLAGRTPRLVSAAWWDKVPPVAWWADRSRSGGPVVEQAVHVLDLARVLVGEVEHVHARSAGPVPGAPDVDAADAAVAAVLSFAGGAVGTLSTASVLGWKHRAGVEVVADGLVVGVGEDWLEVHAGAEPQRYEFDRMTACVAADRAFVDAVAGRHVDPDRSPPDHAEALRTHRLATALARSAVSGAPERVG
jgi:predicted dehydrogenase